MNTEDYIENKNLEEGFPFLRSTRNITTPREKYDGDWDTWYREEKDDDEKMYYQELDRIINLDDDIEEMDEEIDVGFKFHPTDRSPVTFYFTSKGKKYKTTMLYIDVTEQIWKRGPKEAAQKIYERIFRDAHRVRN